MPVLQPGLERQRVLPGEGALAAEGGDDRRVAAVSASARSLPDGVRPYDSAARDDRRASGRRQQVGRHGGQFGARAQRLGGRVHRRDQRQSRPRPAGRPAGSPPTPGRAGRVSADSQAAAIADGIWDGVRDGVDGLDDAAERGRLVGQFVQVAVPAAAQAGGRDLAADRQHGRGGGRRLLERGERGQRARAGGEQQRGDVRR